ncbi:rhombotarget lipoprotein [Microbulbifer sp. TYP-18]|uniref:rhombotarget lipoprotein n=1 Tax=Microbulbifer sp. TYP-18 TaxID=3230024 RepID=UPI0034C62823
MKPSKKYLFLIILLVNSVALSNCGFVRSQHYSSSAVQYLYPNEDERIESPGIPQLTLPLKVGVAFVPEGTRGKQTLTEKDKIDLMYEVSKNFKKFTFVKSIELIPSAYLKKQGGFTNLDQIRTIYDIDVVALLSYDQTQFTDEGIASITYWTLVGAYVIPGEKNDTNTMVDASVYDIQSRKMLFRAPGISHIKSKATPVNLSEQLRADKIDGFKEASKDLVTNLEIQLELFKEKVKELPEDFQIAHSPGYTGGGSLDAATVIFLALISAYFFYSRRTKKT